MIKYISGIYKKKSKHFFINKNPPFWEKEFKKKKWSVFLTITFGYGFYYVCRLSFSVIKKSLVDEGIFTPTELGIIGSALFFTYAFGKLTNGILADRVNIRVFMFTGLFISAVINMILGFTTFFWFFLILWGINGWVQSFGAPSSVVSVSQWTSDKERGSFYGMWSSSHNIGEAITFLGTAVVVSTFGWMWGFRLAGILCFIVSFFILRYLYESPETYGLPSPHKSDQSKESKKIGDIQWKVFKTPTIWILALSSSFFYVTRYGINSWGIFFLEIEKGYSTIEAGTIISVNAISGILGTFFSGILSDKFFGGKRNIPALIFGVLYVISISMFLLLPANFWTDTLSMVLFGLSLGVLLVYLGGLMAVDIFPKEVSGTTLGVIGVASYLGAGIQDIISGYLIEREKIIVDGQTIYNFQTVSWFWIGASIASLLLATMVWNIKKSE